MPYGYLSMVYLVLFLPFLYHRVMAKKVLEWDEKYATKEGLQEMFEFKEYEFK